MLEPGTKEQLTSVVTDQQSTVGDVLVDTALVVSLLANSTYYLRVGLEMDVASVETIDVQLAFTGTTTAQTRLFYHFPIANSIGTFELNTRYGTSATEEIPQLWGVIHTGSGGLLRVQYAKYTQVGATKLWIRPGSHIVATRI